MASERPKQTESASGIGITLGLLNAVQENSDLSQRSMAKQLGIALGLANNYLKRCVKKGDAVKLVSGALSD